MLLTIAGIILIAWLVGVVIHAGSFIYALLIIGLIIVIYDLLIAKRR